MLQNHHRVLSGLAFAALLVLALIPRMLPGALANNLWSISAIKRIFSERQTDGQLPSPPPYHPHGEIWVRRFALAQAQSQWQMMVESDFVEKVEPDSEGRWVDSIAKYGDIEALDVKAEYFYQEGRYLEAIETWKNIGNGSALEEAASEASVYGITTLAVLAYQAAYEIDPLKYTLPLARTLQENGEDDRAITLLESAIQNHPFAKQRENWLSRLGQIYRSQSAWDQAAMTYQRLLAENPTSPDAWIGMGWLSYERDQNSGEALAHFERAIAFQPQNAAGYTALGSLHASKGQHKQAAAWYFRALECDREVPNSRLRYAEALQDAGLTERAIAEYLTLITRFPDFAPAYDHLAWICHKSGHPDQAVIAIESALGVSDIPQCVYFVHAAQIYQANDLPKKAQDIYFSGEVAFQGLIERYPDFPEPYAQMASFYEAFDQIDQAITASEKALNRMTLPSIPIYLDAGGRFEQAGLNEQALAAYQAVLAVDSKNTSAKQGLARLLGGD